jgi:ADP-ribose pyrophosphatase YjhB (NUDIX family)
MLRVIRRTLLTGSLDMYGAFTIDNSALPVNFEAQLDASIAEWRGKHRALWLTLKEDQLSLLSSCIARGFRTHSSDPSCNSLRLSLWLADEPSTLPFYSNHYAGVGGIVLDDQDNCLVIKTHRSPVTIQWRLPGGLVEDHEFFEDAVVREVLEETGVQSRVVGLLGIREQNNYLFSRRDIYSLFLLEPLTSAIHIADTHEIAECTWMPVRKWLDCSELGDALNMVKLLAPDSGSFKAGLKAKTLSRVAHEWRLPHYSKKNFFWIKAGN